MNKRRYIRGLYSLGKSFLYAFRGLKFAIDNERNMRIHLTVTVFVTEFALLYQLRSFEYAILLLLFGLVITAEMLNTAIEALVNLNTQAYDNLARVAKDVAAGAVLVLSITAVVVGLIFFSNLKKLGAVFELLIDQPVLIVIALLEIAVAFLFVFFWNSRRSIGKK